MTISKLGAGQGERGGGKKNLPSKRNFNLVGRGHVLWLKIITAEVEKVSSLGGMSRATVGVDKNHGGVWCSGTERTVNRPQVIAALEVLVDNSLNMVAVRELGSSEL